MSGKTPVSALQEFCVKKLSYMPRYKFSECTNGSKKFLCNVQAFDETAEGVGISQKVAKQDAAANIIKILEISHPEIKNEQIISNEAVTYNVRDKLRDICIRDNHPLPYLEIISETTPPQCPMFTAECRVGSISEKASATTKSGAKQLAAQKVLTIIETMPINNNEQVMPIISLNMNDETDQEKLKAYRKRVELRKLYAPGALSTRHNYFKKFNSNLRKKALTILEDKSIVSDQQKVHLLLNALEIKYRVDKRRIPTGVYWEFVELLCELDAVFMAPNKEIYRDILDYFSDML